MKPWTLILTLLLSCVFAAGCSDTTSRKVCGKILELQRDSPDKATQQSSQPHGALDECMSRYDSKRARIDDSAAWNAHASCIMKSKDLKTASACALKK